MSGLVSRARLSASRPFEASATSWKLCRVSSSARTPRRITSWSSAISTRLTGPDIPFTPQFADQPKRLDPVRLTDDLARAVRTDQSGKAPTPAFERVLRRAAIGSCPYKPALDHQGRTRPEVPARSLAWTREIKRSLRGISG